MNFMDKLVEKWNNGVTKIFRRFIHMNKVKRFSILSVAALLSATCALGLGFMRQSHVASAEELQPASENETPAVVYTGATIHYALVTYDLKPTSRNYNMVLLGNSSINYPYMLDTVCNPNDPESYEKGEFCAHYCVMPIISGTQAVHNEYRYFKGYDTFTETSATNYGVMAPITAYTQRSLLYGYNSGVLSSDKPISFSYPLGNVSQIYFSIAFHGVVYDFEVKVGSSYSFWALAESSWISYVCDYNVSVSASGITITTSRYMEMDGVQNMIAFAL